MKQFTDRERDRERDAMVPQECIQHQEQLVGETSQNIVDIPTVQDQVIIQETPEVQVVERIQEQTMDPIKVVPEERMQQHIVEQIVDVTVPRRILPRTLALCSTCSTATMRRQRLLS